MPGPMRVLLHEWLACDGKVKFNFRRVPAKTIRELRGTSGLTQAEFWGLFGATQSTGSRYEQSHHQPPRPMNAALRLYMEQHRQ